MYFDRSRVYGAGSKKLIPYKGLTFRVQESADVVVEFVERERQYRRSNS